MPPDDGARAYVGDGVAVDMPGAPRAQGGLSLPQLSQLARETAAAMTGMTVEAVSRIGRTPDGQWEAVVDLLELKQVPSSGDILASYRLEFDREGGVVAYERLKRWRRGSGLSED